MRDIANAIRYSGKVADDEINQALDLFGETEEFWRNLVSLDLIKEEEVFQALAEYSHLEYVDLTGVTLEASVLTILPAPFCRKEQVLPIGARGDHLFLAISDPSNIIAIDDVASMSSYIVAPKVVAPSILQQAIDRYLRSDEELSGLAEQIGEGAVSEEDNEDITNGDDDAPIVRFVNLLISQAIQDRASDIHVEPGAKELKVRFRIDGVLHEMQKADRSIQAGILSRLKIMADIDIAEKRKPQDGRMSVSHNGKQIDIRVASLPTVWGEKIIMRILDHDSTKRDLASIGMSDENLEKFRYATSKPHGMVLVTGPTGSGKALALSTPLPTPHGWTTMGEVKVGDTLLDSSLRPTTVTGLSEINETPELYRITLSDGQEILADGDHQWIVATHDSRNNRNRADAKKRLARREAAHEAASSLRALAALYDPQEIVTFEAFEEAVKAEGADLYLPGKSVWGALKFMHAWLDPIQVNNKGKLRYELLAYQSFMLVADRLELRYHGKEKELLYTYTTSEMVEEGLELHGSSNFAIPFATQTESFDYGHITTHAEALTLRQSLSKSQSWLYIKSIESVQATDGAYEAARCITVDSPDSSYLCNDFVVTHNSTTLYTTLDEVSNSTVNVITVEDPVEKRIEGVNQVQINNKAGLTFPAALKSILRADPDIVLIGEIRDGETATIAIEASLTGHLVLSTLHTNGAPDALPRLIEMGVEPYLVSTAVSCVVAQRLARRLCEKCKEEVDSDEAVMDNLSFPKDEKGKYPKVWIAKGCSTCSNTGYRGRLALLEVMPVSETIERMVVNHAAASELRNAANEEGLVSLRQDGFRQVLTGLTTIEEVLRVTA